VRLPPLTFRLPGMTIHHMDSGWRIETLVLANSLFVRSLSNWKEGAVIRDGRLDVTSVTVVVVLGLVILLVPSMGGTTEKLEGGLFIEEEISIDALLPTDQLSDRDIDAKSQAPTFVPDTSSERDNESLSPKTTVTLLTEGFEGAFPGNWGISGGSIYWDDTSYRHHAGSWSAWCADGGTLGQPAGGTYLNDMNTWMTYGPFNLSDATAGSMTFWLWLDSETDYDWFGYVVSVNGSNWYGYRTSGSTGGWSSRSIDFRNVPTLGNVTGDSSVWIGFYFQSDGSVVREGAYVDDVYVSKTTSSGAPDLTVISPSVNNSAPRIGESFLLSATARNQGSASSNSTTLRWYSSTNEAISTMDSQIATDSVPGLAPGGSSYEEVYGSYSTSGTRWVGACVDSVSGESNVTNNCSAGVQVNVGGGGGCTPSSTTLCLQNGRFEVSIDYRLQNGTTGRAQCASPKTDDSGLLYFTNPDNWEFLIKILRGCNNNNHYWVFFAATTNQEFTVYVRDTTTNQVRTYFNPLGQRADAVTDTTAFATCP
jgi:hypothetical protein